MKNKIKSRDSRSLNESRPIQVSNLTFLQDPTSSAGVGTGKDQELSRKKGPWWYIGIGVREEEEEEKEGAERVNPALNSANYRTRLVHHSC